VRRLRVRFGRKILWLLIALVALPALWILEVEVTYERNVRHGIPADFREHRQQEVVLWKV
jgi:hypothetical protein